MNCLVVDGKEGEARRGTREGREETEGDTTIEVDTIITHRRRGEVGGEMITTRIRRKVTMMITGTREEGGGIVTKNILRSCYIILF